LTHRAAFSTAAAVEPLGHMKRKNQFGVMVRSYRIGLSLTQQALAQQLGVHAGYIAAIERGQYKLPLKLLGRLADNLGFDRQNLLILAHPEFKELIAQAKSEQKRETSPSWQRFVENRELLNRYKVTNRELRALEHLSLLETVISAKEFLAILILIRDIPSNT
jgi:transcriptional regulator with XRE-family HTH domain